MQLRIQPMLTSFKWVEVFTPLVKGKHNDVLMLVLSRQMIAFGDSLPAADGSSIKFICSAYKAQLLYLPGNNFQLELHNLPACCRRNADNSGDDATNICPGMCIFQDIVQEKMGPFVFLATSIFYCLNCTYVIIPAEIFDICKSTYSCFNSHRKFALQMN
ncbi:hypothetical protein KY284_014550 [Solanum tuberosum]|nr:hypothetical protein KY284_014550 [Solanum tuberosum]